MSSTPRHGSGSGDRAEEDTQGLDNNNNNNSSSSSPTTTEAARRQIREEYAGLPRAGLFVFDRTMEYASGGRYDAAAASYVEDMNHLGRVVGLDNYRRLRSRARDPDRFQLCLLALLREAGFR